MNVLLTFTKILPELFLLSAACFILIMDVFFGKIRPSLTYLLVQITLLVSALLTLPHYGHPPELAFYGFFVTDNLAVILKLFIYLCSFIAFIYARPYLSKINLPSGEYYTLGLFSVLGMIIIVSGHNFISLFLGLELFSLPLYAMIALQRNSSVCIEAAIKYFVIGSLASALLLYGLSLLYGVTRTLDIALVSHAIAQISQVHSLILLLGLVFVVVGVIFKIGAVPFHMWVPDIYEGAPTPIVLFLGTASKIAGIGLIFRLLVDSLSGLAVHWQLLLTVVAILSMALGNLAAIVQNNIKRMLAYSSIAHMGYMSLGLLTATPAGYSAALFYMITYALMTLAAFGLVIIMDYAGYETHEINDLRGLNSRNPWLALMMLFTLFSLAGVPPIVGFMAKVAVIEALILAHQIWLAALALLFSVIGAYYYIRVIKVMYFETAENNTPLTYPIDMKVMISINSIALLIVGIVPGIMLTVCQSAF